MPTSKFLKLAISLSIPLVAAVIGSVFTISSIPTWYSVLEKPSLNPPNWVFGPVWTILYLLMGYALFLVWTAKASSKNINKALKVFGLQLFLNMSWSGVFFGLHEILLGLINIVLLWLAIVWTMYEFSKISKKATYLLIPYLLWVSFASYLNLAILMLNS